MSHYLTQPEEIDLVLMTHELDDDVPYTDGRHASSEMTGVMCHSQSFMNRKLDLADNCK